MTEIYLDACSIIYLTEGAAAWRRATEARLKELPANAGLLTSRISRLECRSKPMRDRDGALLARYEAAFTNVRVVEISAAIIEHATELRARYDFRSPDAIHLATAINEGAEVFITGDASLAKCAWSGPSAFLEARERQSNCTDIGRESDSEADRPASIVVDFVTW